MSRSLGSCVPEPVRVRLGDDPARQLGLTILVLTTGSDGWPHVAMVSVGELVVSAARRLGLALWPASTCAINLSRAGQATLALVTDGRSFSLRCRVLREQMVDPADHPPTRAYDLQVTESLEDTAPYADLLSGVAFRLHDPDAALARWRATRAALRAAMP